MTQATGKNIFKNPPNKNSLFFPLFINWRLCSFGMTAHFHFHPGLTHQGYIHLYIVFHCSCTTFSLSLCPWLILFLDVLKTNIKIYCTFSTNNFRKIPFSCSKMLQVNC